MNSTMLGSDALTTFIIPTIGRETLQRAIDSCEASLSVKGAPPPVLVGYDQGREGEGTTRNKLIKQAKTEFVSFLDDDDSVTSDYIKRLEEEIAAHPEADVIHFRCFFLHGQVLPLVKEVRWSNVGICWSAKRDVLLKHPFVNEPHEDWHLLERLEAARVKIHFSDYLTYRVRH